mgnify:CR=1 FL=1
MNKLNIQNLNDLKSWPFKEAQQILKRNGGISNFKLPTKGYVLLETGYGPSGLPHIGTFGEVARTTMVRHAFRQMSDLPTKLVAFSDDMDALRSVPTNVPGQEMLAAYLGMPLTSVPDPFDKYESFAHHNNAQLRAFLDQFEFEYEFYSATECYKTGVFDTTLLEILALHDEIRALVLPTLGEERQETYSPFLPICAHTGRVLQVPVIRTDPVHGTITYRDQTSEEIEVSVMEGNCKLQWKADWAMRWKTFAVDYEMSGKDLIPSLQLSSQICTLLSGNPPENLTYELFLDEKGEKKEDKEYYKARTLFLFRGTQEVDSDRVGHELLEEVLRGVPLWDEKGPPPKYLFQLLLIVVEDPEFLMVDMTDTPC